MIGGGCEVAPIFLYIPLPIHEKCLFLSACKNSQFMEFGDILYLILIVVFIVFGFFKDLNKKKKQIDESTPTLNEELKDVFREIFSQGGAPQVPPPAPKPARKKPVVEKAPEYAFQSSMSFVADFEGESSLSHYKFPDYEMDSPIEKEVIIEAHPAIKDFTGDDSEAEFQKAILYSEILKRKY